MCSRWVMLCVVGSICSRRGSGLYTMWGLRQNASVNQSSMTCLDGCTPPPAQPPLPLLPSGLFLQPICPVTHASPAPHRISSHHIFIQALPCGSCSSNRPCMCDAIASSPFVCECQSDSVTQRLPLTQAQTQVLTQTQSDSLTQSDTLTVSHSTAAAAAKLGWGWGCRYGAS